MVKFLWYFLIYFCHNAMAQDMIYEKYSYQAYPKGKLQTERKENIEIIVTRGQARWKIQVTTQRRDEQEITMIEMLPDGHFLSGLRTVTDLSGKENEITRIDRKDHTVSVERQSGNNGKTKTYRIPGAKPLAVDASLLMLLRSFPFNEKVEWKVFMVDFSHHAITVRVKHGETETVNVPAGSFVCYRIEVEIRFLIFRASIKYWISQDEPHFLVRHEGKRGPFTASYITELLRIEN